MVPDAEPGRGPLMGILSGLAASEEEMNFVTAVDTPLLLPSLVEHVVRNMGELDVLVPLWHGRPEPLSAAYARRCLPAIRECVGEGRIVSFYPRVRVGYVDEETVRGIDPEGVFFYNVNTPEEYEHIRRMGG